MSATPPEGSPPEGSPPEASPPPPEGGLTVGQAHATLRRLWVGLLVWHVVLLGLSLVLTARGPLVDWPGAALGLLVASGVLLVPGFGVAGFMRMQSYKRSWEGSVVKPGGYLRGNLWVFGVLDLSATLSALSVLCSADPRFAIPAVVAMTLEGINRPTGAPMLAQAPRVGGDG